MTISKCVYCGKRDGTEKEHAVGRLFFPKPRPDNLVTVPACSQCNRGISKDEEYVRAVLLTLMDTEEASAAIRLRAEELRRSFERDEGKPLANLILSSIEWVNVETSAGIMLPNRVPLIGADTDRMYRVFIKIVMGLYYAWKRERLRLITKSSFTCLVWASPSKTYCPKQSGSWPSEECCTSWETGTHSSIGSGTARSCRINPIG